MSNKWGGGTWKWPGNKNLPYPPDYTPPEWVQKVVGKVFNSWRGRVKCIGYNPRFGFWMQSVTNKENFTNVSERAIGVSYFELNELELWEYNAEIAKKEEKRNSNQGR